MELMEVISAKLHGIKITESALNYHGSVTIDKDILLAADMLPLEFVYIWNKNSGTRISTYIFPGESGSRVVCLNGAAARSCQVGDEVIITGVRHMTPEGIWNIKPKVLTFKHDIMVNTIDERLEYDLQKTDTDWDFFVNKK